jgi:hypothetical protein
MALTLREVHVESMWTPEGIPVDSMEDPWNLFGLLMESNRMRGSCVLSELYPTPGYVSCK